MAVPYRTVYPAGPSMIFRQRARAKSILTAAAGGVEDSSSRHRQDGASTRHEARLGGW